MVNIVLRVATVFAVLIVATYGRVVAADLSKAPASVPMPDCSQSWCTGAIVGAFLAGSGTNADVLGSGLSGSVFNAGGSIGIVGGYQYYDGALYFSPRISAGYELSGANGQTPVNAPENNSRYLFLGTVKIGGNIGALLNNMPLKITVPDVIAKSIIAPYAEFGWAKRPWGDAWVSGAGAVFALNYNWLLDIGYKRLQFHNATPNALQVNHDEQLVMLELLKKLF